MENGFFTMPVSEFLEKCTNIMFELAENAPPEKNGKKKQGGGGGGGHKHRRG